ADQATDADALRRRARLHQARPARPDPLRRRGSADQAGLGAPQAGDGQHALRVGRADHRAAFRGHPQAAPGAAATRLGGQHGHRDRAQPRRGQDRGLDRRPRPGGRRPAREGRRRRDAGGGRGQPRFAHGTLPRRGLRQPSPDHRKSRARIDDALIGVGSIRADVPKRPFALFAGLAMLAAACASNPTATSINFGSGVRFVPAVADSLDNVGLGSAVALDATGLPYVTYFGFPAVVKEGEIPIPRPIGSPFLPGILLSSVDANGVWTHGAIEQSKPNAGLPLGITIPFGPVTTDNLQLTADDSNGTAVAAGSDGTVHAAWTTRDGVYYGTTKAGGTSTVEQVFNYGTAVSLAGPISAPGIALDASGNPWVVFSVLGSRGLEVHAATLKGSKWTDQVVATAGTCAGCTQPGPTGIAILRGDPG